MKNESKIKLPFSIDDLFTTQEQRDDMKKEKIEQIDIKLLDSFTNHPFNVIENSELEKLEKSISENGILEPIIVRKKDNDRYEIISGHRRKKYESSNDEINKLIYEFCCKCFRINYDKNDYHKLGLNNKTCDDFFVNNKKIIH